MLNEIKRRVVVTGLGAVAPNGIGVEAFWQSSAKGVSGITRLQKEPLVAGNTIQVAGAIYGFAADQYIERKLANRTDRMTHFAFAAMQEALTDARLDLQQEQPQRVGAVIANTLGGVEYVLKQLQALYTRGPRSLSAFTAIAWLHVANVGQAAIRYGFQGYCKTPVNDAAGGLNALGMAYQAIKRGTADILIAGGCESFLHPFILLLLCQQRQFATGADPHSYRPFDRRAVGLVLAEGAGICILEDYEHALARGATIYCEIIGYGQTNDAHGLTTPSEDGTRYARALQLAMKEGSVQARDIAFVNLDGHAITTADQGEADAMRQAFGLLAGQIPVSVPRTTIGHSYAAAGALDAIIAAQALKHSLIPPTINCEELNPRYGLDMVRGEARSFNPASTNVILLGGRGIGGINVALALKKAV